MVSTFDVKVSYWVFVDTNELQHFSGNRLTLRKLHKALKNHGPQHI